MSERQTKRQMDRQPRSTLDKEKQRKTLRRRDPDRLVRERQTDRDRQADTEREDSFSIMAINEHKSKTIVNFYLLLSPEEGLGHTVTVIIYRTETDKQRQALRERERERHTHTHTHTGRERETGRTDKQTETERQEI